MPTSGAAFHFEHAASGHTLIIDANGTLATSKWIGAVAQQRKLLDKPAHISGGTLVATHLAPRAEHGRFPFYDASVFTAVTTGAVFVGIAAAQAIVTETAVAAVSIMVAAVVVESFVAVDAVERIGAAAAGQRVVAIIAEKAVAAAIGPEHVAVQSTKHIAAKHRVVAVASMNRDGHVHRHSAHGVAAAAADDHPGDLQVIDIHTINA